MNMAAKSRLTDCQCHGRAGCPACAGPSRVCVSKGEGGGVTISASTRAVPTAALRCQAGWLTVSRTLLLFARKLRACSILYCTHEAACVNGHEAALQAARCPQHFWTAMIRCKLQSSAVELFAEAFAGLSRFHICFLKSQQIWLRCSQTLGAGYASCRLPAKQQMKIRAGRSWASMDLVLRRTSSPDRPAPFIHCFPAGFLCTAATAFAFGLEVRDVCADRLAIGAMHRKCGLVGSIAATLSAPSTQRLGLLAGPAGLCPGLLARPCAGPFWLRITALVWCPGNRFSDPLGKRPPRMIVMPLPFLFMPSFQAQRLHVWRKEGNLSEAVGGRGTWRKGTTPSCHWRQWRR